MLRALAAAAPEASIEALVAGDVPAVQWPANVRCRALPARGTRDTFYRHVTIPAFLEEAQPHCLFAPATLLPALKLCPMVTVVHDLTFLTHPELYGAGLLSHLDREFVPSLRNADHIVAIAAQTKNELQTQFAIPADRITVIEQPVRTIFHRRLEPDHAQRVLAQKGVRTPYFFHVSNLAPHKNVLFAVEAFARFLHAHPTAPHRFFFAGGGVAPNQPPDPVAHAATFGIAERVQYLGRLSDEELVVLYQGCDAVLFPSLAEGWGLPVAEANALKVPVLAAEHVPAAEPHQRLALEVEAWAEAMRQPQRFVARNEPIDPRAAGKALFELLAQAQIREPLHIPDRKIGAPSVSPRTTRPVEAQRGIPIAPPAQAAPATSATAVAYRADWHSPSGFGEAARRMGLALDAAGIDWTPVGVAKDRIQRPDLFRPVVHRDLPPAACFIHHLPPDFYDLRPPGRHIGVFAWETDRLSSRDIPGGRAWIEALNRLDEVWVPSQFLLKVLTDSGVRTPAFVLPHPIDTAFYT
ncbi:MAG: glycosyltransferase family 4 protein, partial [Planctomycetota bacterium]